MRVLRRAIVLAVLVAVLAACASSPVGKAVQVADYETKVVVAAARLGAPPATVSALSHREQGYDRDTTDAIAELSRLNEEYEARFGFRFCVFVDGRSRRALVPVLEAALHAERGAEIRRALTDVVAIARDRARQATIEAGVA